MINDSYTMQRALQVKEKLFKKKIKSFLITNLKNIRYLTGFTGSSAFLLLSKRGDFFFTDFRYKEQSEREVSNVEIVIIKKDPLKFIENYVKQLGIKKLAIEDSVTYRMFKRLSRSFTLITINDMIENLRIRKGKEELVKLKGAAKKAEKAFTEVKGYIRKGNTEKSIAIRLEERLKQNGVQMLPFDIIVASGINSSLPHARPSEKKLEPGDLVIIDWGGEEDGYFSDMTRTFLIHGPDLHKKKEIYTITLEANRKAISIIKKGLSMHQIDSAARGIINAAGYGEYFGHGTGHGVGLDIHEQPYVSKDAKKRMVDINMVFSIEPGIYIPNLGGVRIEDMVTVSENSAKTITTLSRKLEIL